MQTTTTLTLWEEILADPRFRDLPYKVETTEHGQIIMSPHKLRHSRAQGRLMRLLVQHLGDRGEEIVEFAIETPKGVKVPDVVWISDERLARIPEDAAASPVVPEIVVEVLSAGNTVAEMEDKRRLYFDGGALEVWLVAVDGQVTFYDAAGRMEASRLAPSFPARVEGRSKDEVRRSK